MSLRAVEMGILQLQEDGVCLKRPDPYGKSVPVFEIRQVHHEHV